MHKKKIILIRHGEAASTWDGDDRDPGLSKKGVDQAKSINDFTKSIFSKGYDFMLIKLNQLMILQKVFFQKDMISFQVPKKEL